MATRKPPMRKSEESTEAQLAVAKKQGDAFGEALQAMDRESGAKVQSAGEYEIAVVIEEAEGMWVPKNDSLEWEEPTDENAHVEVAVRDAADGRFIPGLSVTATLTASDGTEVGTHEQPFLWHPWIYHYGRNWTVPGKGDYKVHVRVEPPTFARHDHENGRRYMEPAEADFTITVEPDQKLVEGEG